jgi:hypothetical protein
MFLLSPKAKGFPEISEAVSFIQSQLDEGLKAAHSTHMTFAMVGWPEIFAIVGVLFGGGFFVCWFFYRMGKKSGKLEKYDEDSKNKSR